jgi:hypothetical protein
MQSKNKAKPTVEEGRYIALVARLPCSVCDAAGPSEVHEPKQGSWFLSIALCHDCHQGAFAGWHGQKRAWLLRKMDELDALAVTIRRIAALLLHNGVRP